VDRWLREQRPGDVLKLEIRRDSKVIPLVMHIGESKETFYEVVELAHASEKARRIRDGLLHGLTNPSAAH
jgi:hypothetical protein